MNPGLDPSLPGEADVESVGSRNTQESKEAEVKRVTQGDGQEGRQRPPQLEPRGRP